MWIHAANGTSYAAGKIKCINVRRRASLYYEENRTRSGTQTIKRPAFASSAANGEDFVLVAWHGSEPTPLAFGSELEMVTMKERLITAMTRREKTFDCSQPHQREGF